MNAIEADRLVKRFGNVVAVDDVSFQIQKGEIFGFLGPNGAGKSTTIRMLCGILLPTSGSATIMGFDVTREIDRVKPLVGYMSQSFGLYSDLTVEENLWFYSRLYLEAGTAREKTREVIASLGFESYRKSLAAQLSGGWRQRLALGCAIVHDPEVIFLDEPTAGIDPVSRRTMWDYFYGMAEKGKTLFVTTHYMEEAERCHRIGFIWKGRLAALDSPYRIRSEFRAHEIVTVRTGQLNEAFRRIRQLPGIIDVNIYGEDLHVAVPRADEAIPRLRAAMEEAGISVGRIERIQPSIEDVFVSLSKSEKP
ncbi:MAG: ABC transporter ATP-binding protein [Nitrospirae bacterium]|nr:ABC transporter ATP-binding protein [Nitrospirota bacterium]